MVAPAVAALLTQLASSGLNLIGSAVLAKGKEVVEAKLGVNLEEQLGTPEGKIQLMQIQAEREEDLHKFLLEQRGQELRDVQDAREMNARVNESQFADWLPKNVSAILALTVVIGGGAILAFTQEADVRTAVVGLITLVLGFYFGSSRGSQGKDLTIANLSGERK